MARFLMQVVRRLLAEIATYLRGVSSQCFSINDQSFFGKGEGETRDVERARGTNQPVLKRLS